MLFSFICERGKVYSR